MKYIPLLYLYFLFSSILTAQQQLFVTEKTRPFIHIYTFHQSPPHLRLHKSIKLKGLPGNLLFSPDKKTLYIPLTIDKNTHILETFLIEQDLSLTSKKQGNLPFRGYFATNRQGNRIFCSNYRLGRIAMLELDEKGVYSGKILTELATDRHAHCIETSEDDRFLYVPHTSPNSIFQFKIEEKKLLPLQPVKVSGAISENRGHQPRHIEIHPHNPGLLYSSNEAASSLSLWGLDTKSGQLTLKQTMPALINEEKNQPGRFKASDLEISPDGRHAYMIVRNLVVRTNLQDQIAVFQLDPKTGAILKKVSKAPVGSKARWIKLSKDGRFAFASGDSSQNITVYKVAADGSLALIQTILLRSNPQRLLLR